MANPRALDKRRKSIRNIRKITRTMELIATARFKKAMERAASATDYTRRITKLVGDLTRAGLEVSHPLLEQRDATNRAVLLVLTANRGLCGGYNGNALRLSVQRKKELDELTGGRTVIEVSGKRGISGLKFRGIETGETFTQFDDQPKFEQVEAIANRYLEDFILGRIDRLDVAYTRFVSVSRQEAVVETLLPLGKLDVPTAGQAVQATPAAATESAQQDIYEFVPSAASILEEVVPASFKVKLFKCFLDAAVSEQISRMVAMKSATENASDMIKMLSRTYNRARQSQITGQIMEVIGGVEALKS
jgi:F-type H+-transporting ATPase subunit gamma